jgi:hypothetical protein
MKLGVHEINSDKVGNKPAEDYTSSYGNGNENLQYGTWFLVHSGSYCGVFTPYKDCNNETRSAITQS